MTDKQRTVEEQFVSWLIENRWQLTSLSDSDDHYVAVRKYAYKSEDQRTIDDLLTEFRKENPTEQSQEIERLKDWKNEMITLTTPLLDWGQSKESGIRPGYSIFEEALKRSKEYSKLQQSIKELTEALENASFVLESLSVQSVDKTKALKRIESVLSKCKV